MFKPRPLSVQPKISEFFLRNQQMKRTISVRPKYLGTPLKVVHVDRSGHFCRSDQHVTLHLAKLLSPVPLLCILPTRTMTKRVVAWVGSVQPECAIPFTAGHVEFPKLQTEIFVDGKHPCIIKTNSSHWECLETRTAEHSIPVITRLGTTF